MTPEAAWDQGGGNNPPSVSEVDERLYRRGVGYRGRLGGKSAWQSEAEGSDSEAEGRTEADGGTVLDSDGLERTIEDALKTLDVDHLQDVGLLAHERDPEKYPYTHLTELTTANYVAGNPLYDILHDGRTSFDGPPLLSLKQIACNPVDGTAVTEWRVDMPALTTTDGGWKGKFRTLTRFTGALPNLQNGWLMFYDSVLTSWDVELPSLTSANWMFRNSKFTEWHIDLPSLTGNVQAFMPGTLQSFRGDLSKLVDGTQMFQYSALTSFETTNLDSLETGSAMNIRVERFDYALPRLRTVTNLSGGIVMFGRELRHFNGTLPALKKAPLMFHHCHLDRVSVKRVGDTIRDATGDAEQPPIAIGVDKGLQGQVDAELDIIRAKGWAVTANYNA